MRRHEPWHPALPGNIYLSAASDGMVTAVRSMPMMTIRADGHNPDPPRLAGARINAAMTENIRVLDQYAFMPRFDRRTYGSQQYQSACKDVRYNVSRIW